ncbi:YdaS family helix-turn-helix protein [Pantoea sp. GD03673]|uniref:transcriptional regulator n=1 Tax=Pantoea sp. GD03673 TaxID=2975364 RepID=UPI002446E3C3|nr:YdaS family helix-turn-helix protein [Pantoea sp. GD03673]MDH2066867.1 helix-turn-helix domain-containing protein [Pantoea sp. GD03673]
MKQSFRNVSEQAVRAVGSMSEVSRLFGFNSVQSVANWITNNRVPSERVISLCKLGGWAVTPHQLRPDIYPHPKDGMPGRIIAAPNSR